MRKTHDDDRTPRPGRLAGLLALLLVPGCSDEGSTWIGVDAAVDAAADHSVDRASPDAPPPDARLPDAPLPDSPPPADLPPILDSCPAIVPKTIASPWTTRVKGIGFGGIIKQKTGKYTDVLLKSPKDYTRVGARLDWGGTVVFFGLTSNTGSNVIDANDPGRELQIALYDSTRRWQGCAKTATCGSKSPCGNSITYLGWNPVQGGDECGHGAKVTSYGQFGDALRLRVEPVQWNPDWDATSCVKSACSKYPGGVPVKVAYVFELRFVTKHVVEVMTEVTSKETISHPATAQEFPTLYVSHGKGGPDLPLLVDAGGKTIALTSKGNDGFYYGNFTSPGPWVSWQNKTKSYGVGLAMDQGITAFQGWRGDGTSAPYFHNVRAQLSFGLPAGGTVRGLSYLALGSFATVKSELQAVLKKRPPFGWIDLPATVDVAYKPGSPVALQGWVLDNSVVTQVSVQIDGKQVATLPATKSRADVCLVYPAYPGCPKIGFAGSIPTAGLSGCPHLLQVTATDGDGNSTILGERRLISKP